VAAALIESLTQTVLLSREVCVWIMQEYTDDTAELRKQLDALGGMAALQDPETQLLALQDLEQFVSAVCHLCSAVRVVDACSKFDRETEGFVSAVCHTNNAFARCMLSRSTALSYRTRARGLSSNTLCHLLPHALLR